MRETICFRLSSLNDWNLPVQEKEVLLDINEYRFPNLVCSEKAVKYRDDELLKLARTLMPDLPCVGD